MSNATENSRDSGDSRRRRSRGGQNRRTNNNNSNRSEGRQQGQGRQQGEGRRQSNRSEGNRSEGGRQQGSGSGKPQRRPMPAPIKLSFWQKLLKAIGLYKEPVRPPRPERRPDVVEAKGTREPRRSKTRDARTDSSHEESSREESRDEESGGRGKRDRNRRGERENNRPRGGDPSTVENRRVYVGNLSYDVTESDLEELFKGVGAVRRVEIVYNRNTHRSKGYGFIEMIDVDEAKRTVEVLHDQFFMGRKLTVSGAKSKDHEEAEQEDEKNIAENQAMPPLAPVRPQVTSLIDEPLTEEKPTEPEAKAEIVTSDENHEVPTEEFSPEADAPEEIKDQPNS